MMGYSLISVCISQRLLVSDANEDLVLEDELTDDDELHSYDFANSDLRHQAWYPYPNKTVFLLDALDNLPRLRISDALMRMILWVLREAGANSVPSFKALRKFQDQLRNDAGIRTAKFQSPRGNVFYANDLRDIIAKVSLLHDLASLCKS